MNAPITERFTTCPVCSETKNLPHVAHREIKCARCRVNVGHTSSSKKFAYKPWLGFCPNCNDYAGANERLVLDKEIARNNADLEALDATERAADGKPKDSDGSA